MGSVTRLSGKTCQILISTTHSLGMLLPPRSPRQRAGISFRKIQMSSKMMTGVGVVPKDKELRLIEHFEPEITTANEVKIRTLEVGICGTDREICTFAYGQPPAGGDYLLLGHECLGEVVEVGSAVSSLKPGDLVVPSVRRPCGDPNCIPCREGRQDFCETWRFTERGINQRHGFMTNYFVEEVPYLTPVPNSLVDVAVMAEPLTVAEKGLDQAWQVQKRVPGWEHHNRDGKGRGFGRTAVVLGAGPIGLLGAMKLLLEGFRVFVYSRSPKPNFKAELADSIGAPYISSVKMGVDDLAQEIGNIDLIYEAVGEGHVSFDLKRVLGINGIYIFTGIPAMKPPIPVYADNLMRNIVLKNQAIIGTVNASPQAFTEAIHDLGEFKKRWPQALGSLITGRHSIDAHRELLVGKATGIKNVIRFA
jgi:threonine dehydrogenase-like Zn-dependent dehydrogenase